MGLDELYREIILNHSRNPRNKAVLDFISDDNLLENPVCGDSVKVDVELSESGTISRIRFDGDGCAVSTASASMMSEFLPGKTPQEAEKSADTFLKSISEDSEETLEGWGDLEAFEGVRKYPLRIKCASLPWQAVKLALERIIKDYQ